MSPIILSETSTAPTTGSGSDIKQSENIIRIDVPVPFFMKNEVFASFKQSNYSWNDHKKMVLIVRNYANPMTGNTIVSKTTKTKNIDYSIGGCPLECPFDLNEDFDEALVIDSVPLVFDDLRIPRKYAPFTVSDGQTVVRDICKELKPFVADLNLVNSSESILNDIPIFVFVDGESENSGLSLVGCRRPYKSADLHVMGRYRPDAEILSVDFFRKYHEQNLLAKNRPTKMAVHAVYEKLHGEYPSKGKVYLEFLFRDPTDVFEMPPEDSLCKIAIRPLQGDSNPSMHALWEEMKDIEKWVDILSQISNTGAGVGDCTSFLNSTIHELADDMSENVKAIHELLAREPILDIHRISAMEFSDSLDLVLKRVVEMERVDCDFTDRLWSIIRKCENTDELQDCLQIVFQAVSNKMYRPYLLLTNNTQMAKGLTMVMNGEVASLLELVRHKVMVAMVIECGLTKLFKDYNFVLGMSHLIERGEVDSFAPNASDIPTSVSNLKKLHCLLEIMCLSKERLTLSANCQSGHVKKLLNLFSSQQPLNWHQTYHFDVPSNDILRIMSGLHPIYYKLKMDSQTSLKWATTSAIISPELYINYKSEGKEDIHNRQYYVYVLCEHGMRSERIVQS